jgi:branched-chain amino acid transport system permease protein
VIVAGPGFWRRESGFRMGLVGQGILNGLSSAGIYILVALGLTLVLSIVNIVQMAHGEFYMVGSYCMYYMMSRLGLNFFLSLVIATVFVGGLGIVVERVGFRPLQGDPDRSMIVSIGLMLALQNVMLAIAGGIPKSIRSAFPGVVKISTATISWDRLVIVLVAVLLVAVLFVFVSMTRTGQAMRAISQDRVAASLQGISINRISATAMCMGCGLAAIAGAVVGPIFAVSPTMGSFALMKGIAVIILGGLGSLAGAVAGGFIIGMIDGIVPVLTSAYAASVISFAMVVVILLLRPQGILGHESKM